jgi:hypothetical protein
MKIWKAFGRKRSWPDPSTMTLLQTTYRRVKYPGVCLEELRKATGNLSQDSRLAGRDSNRALSRHRPPYSSSGCHCAAVGCGVGTGRAECWSHDT